MTVHPVTYVMEPLQSLTLTQLIEILHHAPDCPFEFEIVDTKLDNSYSVTQLVQVASNLFSFLEDSRESNISPSSVTMRLSSLA